jgi:hypothetical protein
MAIIGKFRDSMIEVPQCEGGNGELFDGYRASVWDDKKFWQ